MYDLHSHTTHSDGKNTVDELCLSAIEKGLLGLAITDHADTHNFEEKNTLQRISRAATEIGKAKECYRDRLQLFCGVELGGYAFSPEKAERLLSLGGFDVVICSVHYVPNTPFDDPYSRINFSDPAVTDTDVYEYMRAYFTALADNAEIADCDVLGHISCPARYITGLHHRPTDVMYYKETLTRILKTIIERDIALEYNTCGRNSPRFNYYDAQNEEILAMYYALGGRRVTLGSDSHNASFVGRGFETAKKLLTNLGFKYYNYYEQRRAIAVKIGG